MLCNTYLEVQTWVFKCKAIFSFKYYKMLADNKACFRAIKYGGYIKKNILCNAVLNSCLGNKYPKHLLSGPKFVSIKDQICRRFIGFSLGKDSLISKYIISTYYTVCERISCKESKKVVTFADISHRS